MAERDFQNLCVFVYMFTLLLLFDILVFFTSCMKRQTKMVSGTYY